MSFRVESSSEVSPRENEWHRWGTFDERDAAIEECKARARGRTTRRSWRVIDTTTEEYVIRIHLGAGA